MTFPGEALLIKLCDTVEKCLEMTILEPINIKKTGLAKTDVIIDRQKRLMEFKKNLDKTLIKETLLIPNQNSDQLQIKYSPGLEVIRQKIKDKELSKLIQKEFNVARAVIWAEKTLENDDSPVPEDNIDIDWLLKWQDHAGETSSELLQSLWGKILAGEVKSPGKFSLRTLDFLRNLSQKEAEKIQKISSLIISNNFIFKNKEIFESRKISFQLLLELQELGIISGVDSDTIQLEIQSTEKNYFLSHITYQNKIFLIEKPENTSTLDLNSYTISSIGKEVLSLCEYSFDDEYIRFIVNQIKANGYSVKVATILSIVKNKIQFDSKNIETL